MNSRKSQAGRSARTFAVGLAAGAASAAAGYAIGGARPDEEAVPAPVDSGADEGDYQARYPWTKVFDTLRTGLCIVDAANRVGYANPGAHALGVKAEALLEPAALRTLTDHVRSTRMPRQVDMELGGEGEETTAVRVDVSPLPGEELAVELTDISELHRVERVRRDFVANVGHELKTPVGALQLLAEALADAVDDPQAAARFTSRIQHESARMSRLVSELLELSRLQGAEPMPAPVTVLVDRVATEAVDWGRTAASSKEITLVRQGESGLAVPGSENQLATALGNLVGNAIAYSPEGTNVTVDVSLRDGDVRIAVTDQGMGIAAEEQERIFERFYRSDPARSRATGGTGLGLAIVKHIAGNHGGRVEVSSMPGNGATFTLVLPSVATDADNPAPANGELDVQVTNIEEGQP